MLSAKTFGKAILAFREHVFRINLNLTIDAPFIKFCEIRQDPFWSMVIFWSLRLFIWTGMISSRMKIENLLDKYLYHGAKNLQSIQFSCVVFADIWFCWYAFWYLSFWFTLLFLHMKLFQMKNFGLDLSEILSCLYLGDICFTNCF